ncbi:hypothetical protein B0H17DRAFT_1112319 [Mycena rosella]|uniref:N-acetyltransferase domain-containing protein n=1 Tax=Mycena rosella TaxID=1033263 RepID=A0AAD7FJ14_MYCRO|nr:hypothetical protein B0H17DRAFT_1112319 [Mycena rosella]
MAEANPSAVVVPRDNGDIIVRQFEPEDASQVYALLLEGFVYGPESACNTALRKSLFGPVSYATYGGFAVGLSCLFVKERVFQLGGAALCLGAASVFIYMRRCITETFVAYCATARKTDMADIPAYYGIPASADSEQGPGGFWVAAIDSPDRRTSEVVGFLGLDYRVKADPTCGELRRLIVSMRHRRRRIGSLLVTAAIDHARNHSPPLKTLDLETSECQPGAQKLYKNYGFSVVSSRVMSLGSLSSMIVFRFCRTVAE